MSYSFNFTQTLEVSKSQTTPVILDAAHYKNVRAKNQEEKMKKTNSSNNLQGTSASKLDQSVNELKILLSPGK